MFTYVATEFETNGWQGGLHWYKTLDPDWEATPHLNGDARKLSMPAGFLAGTEDLVITMMGGRDKVTAGVKAAAGVNDPPITFLDGAGHWVQQERPTETNENILNFLQDHYECPGN